jgi:sec-independent protein translocase protein TatA
LTGALRTLRGARGLEEVPAMGSLGVPELLVIFVILVLLFGASKIPQLGKGLGEAIKNFKKGLKDDDSSNSSPGSDSETEKRA